jgi:hypothetical protein
MRLRPSKMSRDWLAYHCSLMRAANDASVLCKRQSTDLGKRSDSHSIIRQRSCQTAPQMHSTKGALPNPPASLTGISMIPSETCFPPIREAGYEPIPFRGSCQRLTFCTRPSTSGGGSGYETNPHQSAQ